MRIFFPVPSSTASGNTHVHHFTTLVLECFAWAGLLVLLANLFAWMYRRFVGIKTKFSYVPFVESHMKDVLVLDCTAPKKVPTLSHHKGNRNPAGLRRSDTSTGLVLNAIKQANFWTGGEVLVWTQLPHVTTNHFDVDSFLSVWCYLNRSLALKHESVLRHMSRIGDFREACLCPGLVTSYGAVDLITNIRSAYTALKLVCWLNTLEKKIFTGPYESKDCDAKMLYFLPRFAAVLEDPESAWSDWQDEYTQVVGGFDQLLQGEGSVDIVKKVGLAVVQCPEPLHYYSLFSHTHGCDVVLTIYDHNRYEVECKYTQFVEAWSRPVWPRLDMGPLAALLNQMESMAGLAPNVAWVANKYTDTGPLLRLQDMSAPLSKAQRYGHPTDRPFISSSVSPDAMAAVVQSFLEFGLQGLRPIRGGWSWDQLRDINSGISWHLWSSTVLEQHRNGQLEQLAAGSSRQAGELRRQLSRRLSSECGAAAAGVPMTTPGSPPAAVQQQPIMSDEGGSLLSHDDVAALVASGAMPSRCRVQPRWDLVYGTKRDGFSLHTLYRKAAGKAPTVLLVKDTDGHVFGAFASEPWHIAPRFYGTGETCVFKLHPQRTLYYWKKPRNGSSQNDFFQYSTHSGLGVGGAGHFAIWIDNDLFEGTSSQCDTFGSPCLASAPEFQVTAVELWHLR